VPQSPGLGGPPQSPAVGQGRGGGAGGPSQASSTSMALVPYTAGPQRPSHVNMFNLTDLVYFFIFNHLIRFASPPKLQFYLKYWFYN